MNSPTTLECSHIYCLSCLIEYWQKDKSSMKQCPLCRSSIDSNMSQYMFQTANLIMRKAISFRDANDDIKDPERKALSLKLCCLAREKLEGLYKATVSRRIIMCKLAEFIFM